MAAVGLENRRKIWTHLDKDSLWRKIEQSRVGSIKVKGKEKEIEMNVRQLSKAKLMAHQSKTQVDYNAKFAELVALDLAGQMEFFLKSFIFALGDDWKDVVELYNTFNKYLDSMNESKDLNAVQAADFLQKQGRTRTAMQRRSELSDIDLDKNDRIAFIEYLLLQYKAMILREYFKRHGREPTLDLSNEGVGLTGVGDMLLEELFTMPAGLDPELEKAIEDFASMKKEREAKIKRLETVAAGGGVKGLTAKNELAQMHAQDQTSMNRMELTLEAAKRKAAKFSGEAALAKKKAEEEAESKKKQEESRSKLRARAAMFDRK